MAQRSVASAPSAQSKLLWLGATIFVPFALGYYLSYLFRTINAVIAGRLIADLSLDAAALGLLTSTYFLTATAAQLPLGVALDRYGPGRVQGLCLLIAALGAAVFANAQTIAMLAFGRALIGIGVASAMLAGVKAIVIWFPRERAALLNGLFIALGAAGALTAAQPTEWLLTFYTWREVFVGLAAATAAVGLLLLAVVPTPVAPPAVIGGASGLIDIYRDARFWRLAPLSALMIGTAWALQALWVAPWLRDAAGLTQPQIVQHLAAMAAALCASALGLGVITDRLHQRGIGPEVVLAIVALLLVATELALALRLPIPTMLMWMFVAGTAAGTVLSYTIMLKLFGPALAGRANSALNVLHFGCAFAIQGLVGVIVSQWTPDSAGHYPAQAYAVAFELLAAALAVAVGWYVWPAASAVPGRGVVAVLRSPAAAFVLAAGCVGAVGYIGRASPPPVANAPVDSEGLADRVQRLETQVAARDKAEREEASSRDITQLRARIAGLEQRLATLNFPSSDGGKTLEPCRADGAGAGLLSDRPRKLAFRPKAKALGREQRRILDRVATLLAACGNFEVTISSAGGADKRDAALSQRGATLVAGYLARHGVDGRRVTIAVQGDRNPDESRAGAPTSDRNGAIELIVRYAPARAADEHR